VNGTGLGIDGAPWVQGNPTLFVSGAARQLWSASAARQLWPTPAARQLWSSGAARND
jgi:hypothetical protein